ncbi:LIC_10461 domain-containing protein [Leptospira mayottensis]|uniref:LIC_10461 domain-containing protein n=1 Tax=Leptospira mayottensis TaxID=1137606 RepID=UPI0002BE2007|nr:hypothetical protein [Leptospira mayottensis]AXR61131.1 hypothetical protein DQM68_11000 [Leptospira mayottensis]AZQ02433.1 hypothetical protein LEP1GSC190_10695 [Leptospira mayottensis 200901116]TGN03928.1 hypothetical protein EHR03_11350 [Leptospira mayottensis]
MFRNLKYISIFSFTWIFVTCYQTTLQVTPRKTHFSSPIEESNPDQEYKQGNWIAGLIPSFDPPLISCTNGRPELKIRRGVLDNVIHWTIGGIYTRRTIQIYCLK